MSFFNQLLNIYLLNKADLERTSFKREKANLMCTRSSFSGMVDMDSKINSVVIWKIELHSFSLTESGKENPWVYNKKKCIHFL